MILSADSIKFLRPIENMEDERYVVRGRSAGLSVCSYDLRIDQSLILSPGEFALGSTIEKFNMPLDVAGYVKDKSSWARQGLGAYNTFVDPGFRGYLTLELCNHGHSVLNIQRGDPIVQVVFEWVDKETIGYSGKYSDQEKGPQGVRFE